MNALDAYFSGVVSESLGRYVPVKDLPKFLSKALRASGYNKSDIEIVAAEEVSPPIANSGERAKMFSVNLITGETSPYAFSSFGGSTPLGDRHFTVLDVAQSVRIPDNAAVISGVEGGGHTPFMKIYVRPEVLAPLLGSDGGELTKEQKKMLVIMKTIISSARQDEMRRRNVPGKYASSNPLIVSLIKGGYIKENANGALMITTKGKNVAEANRNIMFESFELSESQDTDRLFGELRSLLNDSSMPEMDRLVQVLGIIIPEMYAASGFEYVDEVAVPYLKSALRKMSSYSLNMIQRSPRSVVFELKKVGAQYGKSINMVPVKSLIELFSEVSFVPFREDDARDESGLGRIFVGVTPGNVHWFAKSEREAKIQRYHLALMWSRKQMV